MTLVLGLGLIVNSGRSFGPGSLGAPQSRGRQASQRRPPTPDWKGEGTQGAVAAGGRGAVAAGSAILKAGGNAADAGAATIFALSVTDSRSFCFGGEVPILFYDAKHQIVTVIDGQGAAPRLATLEHFKRPAGIPAKGIEPAAVPAALDACLTLLDRFGTMTFTQVIAPTKELLKHRPRPEPWHADLLRTLELLEAAEASGQPRLPPRKARRRPTALAGSAWSPTRSTAARSPVASTPGRKRKAR